jgi:hypothetical protein
MEGDTPISLELISQPREAKSRSSLPNAEGVAHRSPGLPHVFAATLGRIVRAVCNPEGIPSRRLDRARTYVLCNPFGVGKGFGSASVCHSRNL